MTQHDPALETAISPQMRDWREIMKPERLAAMLPSWLSKTRSFMSRMIRER